MVMENYSSKSYQANKKEGGTSKNKIAEKLSSAMAPSSSSFAAAAASSSSSRQWTAFRNPRIVRVSRALGGKDRHSKVCTIRGLRDRRIRLSVPTAIQLYDLQDRLGLSQPSKVIDWLIEATKLDIDKLPPLQIPHGTLFPFHHHQQQTLLPPYHQFSLGGTTFHDSNSASNNNNLNLSTFFKDIGGNNNQNLLSKSTRFWDLDSEHSRLKGKEGESSVNVMSITTKGKWIRTGGEHENQDGIDVDGYNNNNNNSSTRQQDKLFPGLLNNNNAAITYNNPSYNDSEPSNNLSLSQFGGLGLFPSSNSHHHQNSGSGVQFSSSSNVVVPSSLFTPYVPFMESDPRQLNHVQILSNSSNNNNNSQVVMQHQHQHHHPLLIPSLNSVINNNNSSLRRIPMPFSSKLLDSSDHNEGRGERNKGSSTTSS